MVALGFASSAKVQLVSQSAKGPFTGSYGMSVNIPFLGKTNGTLNGTMTFNMDVATGSFRMDLLNLTDSDDKKGKDKGGSMLLSAKAKRMYTRFNDDSPDACQFVELPSLPAPSQYVACAENLLQKGKKWFKKDSIYVVKDDTPDQKLGPITIGGSMDLAFQIDADGHIPKVDLAGQFSLLAFPLFIFGAEWSAAESSFGSPDARLFDIPAEWGECTKQEMNYTKLTKVEQKWLKCVQPDVVFSDGLLVV